MKIKSVNVRLATEADAHLPTYDNTKLQAVNTCPTWGILRYDMHKTFASNGRAMALEAGSAMHEVFAAVRLWQLWKYDLPENSEMVVHPQDTAFHVPVLINHHGQRLFRESRWEGMLACAFGAEDERTNCLNFCLQALYSFGFYDDPSDKRRTMSNLEEAAIMYIDRWDFRRMPIWIRDKDDPKSDVGIEHAFDVVIEYTFEHPSSELHKKSYRFTGKLDGIQWKDGTLRVDENKTAARLDDAWVLSFDMSSQVTGYCLAGSIWSGEQITQATVRGLQIPLPKAYESGLVTINTQREPHHLERWLEWFLYSVQMYEQFHHDPINAPKFTHSCNRYFRPCNFLPFCVGDNEEMKLSLEEMITEEWSPLHEVQQVGD